MMSYKRFFTIILLSIVMLLLLAPTGSVQAAPIREDEVIVGDDLTLREGEHIDGDLLMIGGNLTMREGSRVEGNATLIGGNAEVDGTIEGDLVVLGGNVSLGNQARVEGDVVALGGRVRRSAGAQFGSVVQGPATRNLRFWRNLRLFAFPRFIGFRPASTLWATVSALLGAVILALIAMAVYSFWPTQTAEVGRTIVNAPLPSLGIGCLIYPLAAVFSLFILITICLAVFVPVVVLLVVAASLFGWIALGVLLGRWLVRVTAWRSATPLAVAGLGGFALTLVAALLGQIPCLGTMLVIGAASIGLGAVALSRFGTTRHGIPPAELPEPVGPSVPTTPPAESAPPVEATPPAGVEPQVDIEPPHEPAPPAEPEDNDNT
jgi:hypothetical protein